MAWRAPGFDLIEVLGTGATGQVVVSRDEVTGSEVAIKYLSKEVYRAPSFVEEFTHEMATLSSIEHPNLVQIYDYIDGPGTGALVMELVRGTSVRALLNNGPLEPEGAFFVIKAALTGLTMAHRSRIVHRDFRPDNLLVSNDGMVKVADIGLAVRERRHSPKPGDPRYMAPERWSGLPATPGSDVYAAACTLFELLTGEPPKARDKKPLGHSAPAADADLLALMPVELHERVRRLFVHQLAQLPSRRSTNANTMLDEVELTALEAYGPRWEDVGRVQLLRRVARVTGTALTMVPTSSAPAPIPAVALLPLPTRNDAISEAPDGPVREPLPRRVPAQTGPPLIEVQADRAPVEAPISPAPVSPAPVSAAAAAPISPAPGAAHAPAAATAAAGPDDAALAAAALAEAEAAVAAAEPALPPSEAPVSPAIPVPVSPVPVLPAPVAAVAAVATVAAAAADHRTTGGNEVIAAVVDEPAAPAAHTMAPADIATGPAVAAPIAATAPVRAPRAVGTAVPLPPLSPIAPKKPRRGKIGAVRPPTGSTQSSATDIYAPVGSAALIIEAEWAKIAAAVAEKNPPAAKSGILRRLNRRGRLVTAGAVTVVFALVILTLSTGWLGGKSEASPNSNPGVPNFSHSAIVIPGPSIPVPAPSSPTRDNEKPTQPTGLHVISRSQTAVSLDWNASADNIGVMGYIVMRAGKTVGTTYDPGFTDTGLTANSSYHYTVEAFDKAGNKSAVSGTASATTLVAPDTAPPSVPSGLHKTSVSVSTIGLDWSSSHDNIGVAGYDVFRDGRQIATITKTSYVDKGLKSKSTHSYYVRAFDASNNESASSRSVSATTLAQKDTSPPTAPRSLHPVSVSDTAITIGWSASTDNTGVSGYIVTRSGSTFPQTSGLLFSDPGLHDNTTYNYSVVAVDGSGNKSTPATLSVTTTTTPASPTPTPTPTDTGTPDPTPSETETSPPPPSPAVSGVTANVGSVDATDPANCTVTISVTVRVDNGDLPSGSLVHWDGTGIGSGDVGGSYTEGSNNFTIGTFTVTVDGSVTVTIDGFSDSGSWNAPAACNAPTDPPTTDEATTP